MADIRTKEQIEIDHDAHVERDGHGAWRLYNDVPIIDPDRGYLGSISLEVCDFCPQANVNCNHDTNDWNAEGTILQCRLCGMDGT